MRKVTNELVFQFHVNTITSAECLRDSRESRNDRSHPHLQSSDKSACLDASRSRRTSNRERAVDFLIIHGRSAWTRLIKDVRQIRRAVRSVYRA